MPLLPCSVIVRKEADGRYVNRVDPQELLPIAGSPLELRGVAGKVRTTLDAAADALAWAG